MLAAVIRNAKGYNTKGLEQELYLPRRNAGRFLSVKIFSNAKQMYFKNAFQKARNTWVIFDFT